MTEPLTPDLAELKRLLVEALDHEKAGTARAWIPVGTAELAALIAQAEEAERLRKALRWVMTSDAIERGSDRIAEHSCSFDTGGTSCYFHERWVDAAALCGLLDEWADDDAAPGPGLREAGL